MERTTVHIVAVPVTRAGTGGSSVVVSIVAVTTATGPMGFALIQMAKGR
jgi:hypothetical protein